jgi:hypothetical protein
MVCALPKTSFVDGSLLVKPALETELILIKYFLLLNKLDKGPVQVDSILAALGVNDERDIDKIFSNLAHRQPWRSRFLPLTISCLSLIVKFNHIAQLTTTKICILFLLGQNITHH